MEAPARSFGMDSIKAAGGRVASASVRKLVESLFMVLRIVSKLALGEDLVPCAVLTIHGIYLSGKVLYMTTLPDAIFHATNRVTGVISPHVHTSSFSLR